MSVIDWMLIGAATLFALLALWAAGELELQERRHQEEINAISHQKKGAPAIPENARIYPQNEQIEKNIRLRGGQPR
jgi:hypothetical protein